MYYSIYSFMTQDLQLKGTDLNVFALIYSFKEYKGSLESMRKLVGAKSITTIQYSLKRLLEKDLIQKNKPSNKFSTCTYRVSSSVGHSPLRKEVSTRGEWTGDEEECCVIGGHF